MVVISVVTDTVQNNNNSNNKTIQNTEKKLNILTKKRKATFVNFCKILILTFMHNNAYIKLLWVCLAWNCKSAGQAWVQPQPAWTMCIMRLYLNNVLMFFVSSPSAFRCPQCQKCFANSSYLSQHNRIHAGIKPYKCEICERKFTQLSHLQQHIRTHTGNELKDCSLFWSQNVYCHKNIHCQEILNMTKRLHIHTTHRKVWNLMYVNRSWLI